MGGVIVDTSVVVKWFVIEDLRAEARQLLEGTDSLLAPDVLLAEFANVMWVKARNNEIDFALALEAIDSITGERDLRLYPSAPLLRRAFELAHALRHPTYDCIYLALAESLDMPLITADQRFAVVASREDPRVRLLGQDRL